MLRLRELAGTSWVGELLDCFYCLSIWTSAPFAVVVARRWREVPVAWLALSGAACLLERLTREEESTGAPTPDAPVPSLTS